MKGRLFIDGLDAYERFGMYVLEGGYDELVSLPPLERPAEQSWQEEDGVEVDLSRPLLDGRSISLSVSIRSGLTGYRGLMQLLMGGGYHEFWAKSIDRRYKLRLTGAGALKGVESLYLLDLELREDEPLYGKRLEPYQDPSRRQPTGYKIDSRDLSSWGFRVLEGSAASLLKTSKVKPNLEQPLLSGDGVRYDTQLVSLSARDVELRLYTQGGAPSELWQRLWGLLYQLTRAGVHQLETPLKAAPIGCYYLEGRVERFLPDPHNSYLELRLKLRLISNLRV